jgi:hypothetical protein
MAVSAAGEVLAQQDHIGVRRHGDLQGFVDGCAGG